MPDTIKVNILNKEYTLQGEDEDIINRASETLKERITTLKEKNIRENDSLLTLAALNIAKESNNNNDSYKANRAFIVGEINKMADFIESKIL